MAHRMYSKETHHMRMAYTLNHSKKNTHLGYIQQIYNYLSSIEMKNRLILKKKDIFVYF